MKNNNNYIKLEDCKDSYLYIIDARNADIGIYNSERKSFIISRFKFKSNFIFEEDHWDNDPCFGTVKPIKELYKVITDINDEKNLLQFLNEKALEHKEEIINTKLFYYQTKK